MPGHTLVVFAKSPVPGRVKTRLLGDLSPAAAAELAAAFLSDLLSRLAATVARRGVEVRLAWGLEPGEAPPPAPTGSIVQGAGDLGARMLAAATRIAGEGALPVLVGSDLPDLEPAAVEAAFAELERGVDLVLGPASDGGFYLIGLGAAARRPELFEGVEWGGERVLSRTLTNARSLGLAVRLLAEAEDVDRPEDLPRLAARLDPAGGCARTSALLARLGYARDARQESTR